MERLTEKKMKGEGFILADPKEYKAFARGEKPNGKQIYQRLLEIEDILGDDYDLERLRELVEADRDGRLYMFQDLEYPAMHGDPVGPKGDPGVLDNEWYKRASELMEADRDGRCMIAPVKPGEVAWCGFVQRNPVSGETKNIVYPVVLKGWWTGLKCKESDPRLFLFGELHESEEAAEAALKGEQDG